MVLVLGRTGGPAEIAGWVNGLPSLGRNAVALGFVGSQEFRTDAVQEMYGFTSAPVGTLASAIPALLGRTAAPAAAEVNSWVFSALDILSIETGFAASPEYVQITFAGPAIQGQVTVDSTGLPIANVTVGLIDSAGNTAQTTQTDATGHYQFSNLPAGPYVVHAVAPVGFVQTSPTFTTTAPTPASRIDAPFQSPININTVTFPPTDLSQVLQINYAPTAAPTLVETAHDVQVDPSPTASDSVSVNGNEFELVPTIQTGLER